MAMFPRQPRMYWQSGPPGQSLFVNILVAARNDAGLSPLGQGEIGKETRSLLLPKRLNQQRFRATTVPRRKRLLACRSGAGSFVV